MKPDFSPLMLALFLRARAAHRAGMEGCVRDSAARRTKADIRRLSKRTHAEIDMAWMARLLRPEPRAAIWAVLGHFPGDHGLRLTHGGQEGCSLLTASAPAALPADGAPETSGGPQSRPGREAST